MRRLISFLVAGLLSGLFAAHQARADGFEPGQGGRLMAPRAQHGWNGPARPYYGAAMPRRHGYGRPSAYREAPPPAPDYGYEGDGPMLVELRKPYIGYGLAYNVPPEPVWAHGWRRGHGRGYGPVIRARY